MMSNNTMKKSCFRRCPCCGQGYICRCCMSSSVEPVYTCTSGSTCGCGCVSGNGNGNTGGSISSGCCPCRCRQR